MLCPTRRVIHSLDGTTISSTATAAAEQDERREKPERQRAGLRVGPCEPEEQQERRQGERQRVDELEVEADRPERPRRSPAAARRRAHRAQARRGSRAPAPRRSRRPMWTGSGTGSAASAAMNSEVFTTTDLRQAAPIDFSARCSATRTATSVIVEPRRGRRDRLAVERDRLDDVALARVERLHQLLRVAERVRILLGGRGEKILEILDILGAPRAPPAHRVDDLVASDRVHPGAELLARVPGVALEMDRQQSLLHRILDIGVAKPRARERRPRHRPDRTADFLQKSPVDALVARDRGLHHPRPGIVRGTFDRHVAPWTFASVSAGVTGPGDFFRWARTRNRTRRTL